jgi:NAD(P)-dependent dehydrogenase (short-subunit alcohol dehydrogenase family)
MTSVPYRTALIVGAGSGISASVARGLATAGLKVGLAARNVDKLSSLAAEAGAERFTVDASDPAAVAHLFDEVDTRLGLPDVVLYNASARAHGSIAELDPKGGRDIGLRRLFGRATGGTADDPARRRCNLADRRQCQRQGLSALSGVRDGQVCLTWSGAKHSTGAGSEGDPCRAFRDRRCGAQRPTAGPERATGQHT